MALTTAGLNAAVEGITGQVTYIALLDDTGTEISRLATTWGSASSGDQHIASDLTFDVSASTTVGGWTGFDASTGGTDYGGEDVTQEIFAGDGEYVLKATETYYSATSST